MSDLLARAELTKLSRLLGCSEAAVAFLAKRDHLELRRLGERLSNALFDEHRTAFQRLADASRLLPASLVAKMSELVFGPMLSARIAGLMAPQRAVDVATKLRHKFLVEVTIELDPRSAAELLGLIPQRLVVEVARQLLARGEYLTIGRFVDDLPDAAIRAVIDEVSDDAALVRIAGYVERRDRLIELTEMIPAARLRRIVARVADGPEDVQQAGFVMMSQLSDRQQGRVGDIAIALGPERLKALTAAAGRLGAGSVIRSVLGKISPESRLELVRILPGYILA